MQAVPAAFLTQVQAALRLNATSVRLRKDPAIGMANQGSLDTLGKVVKSVTLSQDHYETVSSMRMKTSNSSVHPLREHRIGAVG